MPSMDSANGRLAGPTQQVPRAVLPTSTNLLWENFQGPEGM